MSTKKRFSISDELASGIRNSMQSAATNHGQLHYDMMSIDVIQPDPENPRKLSISRQELIDGINKSDSNYDAKLKDIESLTELAESIKRVGIRNAIEVYKDEAGYKIISGERRYLASILAGQKYIPARINSKPDEFKLRYMQWVENINRQDLSLWEKFNNLSSISEVYKKTSQVEVDASKLKELLGVSDVQAYRYFCLLKADKEVINLVKLGKLTNLKVIQELVSVKSKTERASILEKILNQGENTTSLSTFKNITKKNKRKSSFISLGKISDVNIARYILDVLLTDSKLAKHRANFSNIDWTSSRAIAKAFKSIFDVVEKELKVEETV